MSKIKLSKGDKILQTVCYILTAIWLFALLVPPYWLIISSLKDGTDAFKSPPSFTPTMPLAYEFVIEGDENYDQDDFLRDSTLALWMMCERLSGTHASKYTALWQKDGRIKASNTIVTMDYGKARYNIFPGSVNQNQITLKFDEIMEWAKKNNNIKLNLNYKFKTQKTGSLSDKMSEFLTNMVDEENTGNLSNNDRLLNFEADFVAVTYKNQPTAIFNNWISAFKNFTYQDFTFATFLKNSIVIAVLCILLQLLLNGMTGYGLSKIVPKRFKSPLMMFFLIPLMIPGIASTLPMYILIIQLKMMNNQWAIIIPSIASTINIVLFKGFFDNVPHDLYEAATLDGASQFGIFSRIYLPISFSVFGVIAMFTFVGQWNNFFWPFMILKEPNLMTFPIVIKQLMSVNSGQVDFAVAMSMSVIVSVPTLIIFAFFQKQMTSGIVFSGLKG